MDQKKEKIVRKVSLDGLRAAGPKVGADVVGRPVVSNKPAVSNSSSVKDSNVSNSVKPVSVAEKPASVPGKQISDDKPSSMKRKKAKSVRKGNPLVLILGCLVVAIVVIATALVIRNLNGGDEADSGPTVSNEDTSPTTKPTEEEERITKETLEKYLDAKIEGYKEDTFGENVSEAIVVSMHNKSEEKVSLMMEIIAVDKSGEIKDSAYVSAENMLPEETQSFPMFVDSEIPMEELKNMEFKVYRASTYDPTPVVDAE